MAEILELEQLVNEAQKAYRGADYRKAVENYKAAQVGYQAKGDSIKAAEMANNCSVALLRAKDAPGALLILEGVDKIFENVGDFRGLAITCGNRGAALEALGRRQEASQDYEKAAELFKQIGDREFYATTMQSLSALQLRTGRSLEALTTMQIGIDQIEHPNFTHRILKRLLNIPFRLMNR